MLKNKFKLIALLTLLVLTLTIPIVRAEDETADPNADVQTTAENSADEVASEPEPEAEDIHNEEIANEENTENDLTNSDVYLVGDEVTIDYIVDGNVFVFANTVKINSQIGGNVFVCAKNITIEENGFIVSSLLAFSEKVNVNGVVCDLYAAAKEVNITGYIYRDIRIGADTFTLNGIVGRNAFVSSNNINFTTTDEENNISSTGIISGDFNYTANEEISIPEGVVAGKVTFTEKKLNDDKSISSYILNLGTFVCTVIIIWLLGLWLAPKAIKNTYNLLSKKVLPILGYGILTPIVLIAAFVIFLLLGITANISLLLLVVLVLLMAISSSVFVIVSNNLICSKLKVEKTIQTFGILILSAIIYWLITLIPFVGSVISLVTGFIGLGIIVYNILPLKSKNNEVEVKS